MTIATRAPPLRIARHIESRPWAFSSSLCSETEVTYVFSGIFSGMCCHHCSNSVSASSTTRGKYRIEHLLKRLPNVRFAEDLHEVFVTVVHLTIVRHAGRAPHPNALVLDDT